MDEWQGGLSPFQNLKWITLTFSLFSPSSLSPLSFMLFAGNSQHHWCGLFPVCGTRTKESRFLSMLPPSLSPTLSLFILLSLSNLSLYLFFYLSVLMIYFARTPDPRRVWVSSIASKERFMSVISILDSDSDKTRLDVSQLCCYAVLFITPLISFLAASWFLISTSLWTEKGPPCMRMKWS